MASKPTAPIITDYCVMCSDEAVTRDGLCDGCRHPDADKFDPGAWERAGHCICGAELPPQREWIDAGGAWPMVKCAACGRGYVDEEEFIAFYSAEQWAEYEETE